MIILGITSPISWNSAAAIVKDGQLLAAVEEERFNGIKHSPRILPQKSIEFCLSFARVKPEDVDAIALGFLSPAGYWTKTVLENFKEGDFSRVLRECGTTAEYFVGMVRLSEWLSKKGFRMEGDKKIVLRFYPHHLAHAASAFRCSGFQSANVITVDGQGEDDSGSIWKAENNKLRKILKIGHHQSIGWVYSEATNLLGFKSHSHEGKIMGLAGWGKRRLPTDELWAVSENDYLLQKKWLDKFYQQFGPVRNRYDDLTDRHRNIALTVQKFTERAGVALAKKAYSKNKSENFCLAGGVTLNCDTNQRISELPFVENLFIQPAANDAGTAIGGALELANELGENADFEMRHAYWGPEYSNDEIENVLREAKVNYEKVKNIEKITAEMINKGKIIGWFQGRLEIGPRALGHRSILAHPGLKGMKDKVNKEVKHRENWRPFAPSILHESGNDYLKNYRKHQFMVLTFDATKKGLIDISQTVHVDGTARPQSVEKDVDPRYYKLISEFGKLSGVKAVLNTSFNDSEQPLVNTPKEAVKTFFGTGLDILAIGDFIVEKSIKNK